MKTRIIIVEVLDDENFSKTLNAIMELRSVTECTITTNDSEQIK